MQVGGKVVRWVVGVGALLVAIGALYVLTIGEPPFSSTDGARPAMDEIDEESRAAMRDLLRED
jgi:hypothetical protein